MASREQLRVDPIQLRPPRDSFHQFVIYAAANSARETEISHGHASGGVRLVSKTQKRLRVGFEAAPFNGSARSKKQQVPAPVHLHWTTILPAAGCRYAAVVPIQIDDTTEPWQKCCIQGPFPSVHANSGRPGRRNDISAGV